MWKLEIIPVEFPSFNKLFEVAAFATKALKTFNDSLLIKILHFFEIEQSNLMALFGL